MRLTTQIFHLFFRTICTILFFVSHSAAYTIEEIMGEIDPRTSSGVIALPMTMTTGKERKYLRQDAYTGFVQMHNAAKKDKISLRVRSAFRSYDEQVQIFRNYAYERAMPPGTSSHNFGIAVDIDQTVSGSATFNRLMEHAGAFGFCQTYDGKSSWQMHEPRHREYMPHLHRQLLSEHSDGLYIHLLKAWFILPEMTKQNLLDTYIFPISDGCKALDTSEPADVRDTSVYYDQFSKVLFALESVASTPDVWLYALDNEQALVELDSQMSAESPRAVVLRAQDGKLTFLRHHTSPRTKASSFSKRISTKKNPLQLSRLRRYLQKTFIDPVSISIGG